MEKDPWYKHVEGPFREWKGPVGVKPDGGGSTKGQGTVGEMKLHRAVNNHDTEEIMRLIDAGQDVNEVEAAGNTPLHNAAWEGWLAGVQLLVGQGALVNATNNAGDSPWHWAMNMGHKDVMQYLQENGAKMEAGDVLVQDHIPKVKDFFEKECWSHHPKPHKDYMSWRLEEDDRIKMESSKLLPGV